MTSLHEQPPSKQGKVFQFLNPTFDPNARRNVVDHLKWLKTDEEIIDVIDKNKQNFSLLLINIDYDNNIGSIIRSANVFGAREILIYGRKKFDRRASVGTEFYMRFRQIRFIEEIDPVFAEFDTVVALENNISYPVVALPRYQWEASKKTLICVGQEGNGIDDLILKKCDTCLEIPQFGSVRSLNVASASSIVMYDYCIKTHAFEKLYSPS